MARYVIDQTKLGIQKISNATLREDHELDKEIKNIYEITFVVKVRRGGVPHDGIDSAQLDSDQDDQEFLGIRKDSLEAFWTDTNLRIPINYQDRDSHQNCDFGPRASVSRALSESWNQNQNLNQAEYVEVKILNTKRIKIMWMFNQPEKVVPHFEFEFKLG